MTTYHCITHFQQVNASKYIPKNVRNTYPFLIVVLDERRIYSSTYVRVLSKIISLDIRIFYSRENSILCYLIGYKVTKDKVVLFKI